MSKKSTFGSALLLLGASFIWGVAFVAQSAGMAYVGPFTFTVVRGLLAALFLVPCAILFERSSLVPQENRATPRQELVSGLILGVLLFFAANLQQLGLQYTTAGKAGFITSLYIIIIPIVGLIFRRRVHPLLWICVIIALVGFYFLSIHDNLSIGRGDLLTLLCAFCFAFHIMYVEHVAPRMNVVKLSCIQFFVLALFSVPLMLLLEKPTPSAILAAWLPIVYAGVCSGGIAYTMQMLGQRRIEATAASLLCSPESVFAALAGWVLLGERMNGRELLGCALVFLAVVCSQLPWSRFLKRKSSQA